MLVEKTTFFSVSIIALAIFYGIGLIPLFIFSCTLAFVVIGELAFRSVGENVKSYFAYIVVAALSPFSLPCISMKQPPFPSFSA